MSVPEEDRPPQTRREREHLQDRLDILEAAAELFARHGFAHTSMQQIAERAEFSVGKLYKYFEGKDAIYLDLHRYHMERVDAYLLSQTDPEASPLTQLRQQMRAVVQYFNEHPDFMLIYARDATLKADREIQEHKARDEAEIAELLRAAMEAGEIAREDPELLSGLLMGVIERLFIGIALRGEEKPRYDAAAELVDRIVFDPLIRRGQEEREEKQKD